MAQGVIHKHDRHHCFSYRRRPNTNTRIMPAMGHDFGGLATRRDGLAGQTDTRRWLQSHTNYNILPATDASKNAACTISFKFGGGNFIAMLRA